MRLLFLSDFHGRVPPLDEWPADLIVAGGDYCEVDEIRRLKFAAIEQGRHPREWPSLVGEARAEELIDRALAEGSAVVATLAASGLPVLAIPGNSDRVGSYGPHLVKRHQPRPDVPQVEDRVTNLENRLVPFDGLAFAGLGGWSGPREPTEERREVEDLLAARPDVPQPLVLVSHNVPHGSSLDGVDNPALPAFAQGRLVGSQRCRHAVDALAPVLCLCGHLHEKYGRVERIGRTLCINGAGAYRGEGVLIDVEPDGRVGEPMLVRSRAGAERVLT